MNAPRAKRGTARRHICALACAALVLVGGLGAPAAVQAQSSASAASTTPPDRQPASAVLERCVTSATQLERYATFAGKMVLLPGATGMSMRIDVEERLPGELGFHPLEGAGTPSLGVWRTAEPGVKIFKDLKQVTNLTAPAAYRAVISFRWTGPKQPGGKDVVLKRELLRTPVCRQPPPERQFGGEASIARIRRR